MKNYVFFIIFLIEKNYVILYNYSIVNRIEVLDMASNTCGSKNTGNKNTGNKNTNNKTINKGSNLCSGSSGNSGGTTKTTYCSPSTPSYKSVETENYNLYSNTCSSYGGNNYSYSGYDNGYSSYDNNYSYSNYNNYNNDYSNYNSDSIAVDSTSTKTQVSNQCLPNSNGDYLTNDSNVKVKTDFSGIKTGGSLTNSSDLFKEKIASSNLCASSSNKKEYKNDAFTWFETDNKKDKTSDTTKFNFGEFNKNIDSLKDQKPEITPIKTDPCAPKTTKKVDSNTNEKERNYFDPFNLQNWKDFGKELLNSTIRTGATIGTTVVSLGEGLAIGGEALLDAGGLIATGLCSIPTLIYDGITYNSRPEGMESATEYLWNQAQKKIQEERVKGSMDDVFYQDIKLGKALKEKSYGFDINRNISNTIGYAVEMIGAATAASAAMAGAGAAATTTATNTSMGITGGLAGFGKGTEKAWNDGAGDLATAVGTLNGLYEGMQFYTGGELASAKVFKNKVADIAAKSMINGLLNGSKMPLDSLIETSYNGKDFKTTFAEKGGVKEYIKNVAIGAGLTALGESINLKKGVDDYVEDVSYNAKAPKLTEYANDEMVKQFKNEYGDFVDPVVIGQRIRYSNIFEKSDDLARSYSGTQEVNGFNNGTVSHIRTDVSINDAKAITFHENIHQVGTFFDENGRQLGSGVEKYVYDPSGKIIDVKNRGINESITELLNKEGPAPNHPSGYDPAVKRLKRLVDDGFLSIDDLKSSSLSTHDVNDLSEKIVEKTTKNSTYLPSEKYLSPKTAKEMGLAGDELIVDGKSIVNKIWSEFDNATSSNQTTQKEGLKAIDRLIDLLEDYYC